jgi:hypothetical protein
LSVGRERGRSDSNALSGASAAKEYCPGTHDQVPVALKKPFHQSGFLHYLEHLRAFETPVANQQMPAMLVDLLIVTDGIARPTRAVPLLIQLLRAYEATLQTAFDTELAADELRRYQKFARPGQPSSHIVQLRQRQAAARQASNQSRQALIQSAALFVREAGIQVPERVALDTFITGWIDLHVPKERAAGSEKQV